MDQIITDDSEVREAFVKSVERHVDNWESDKSQNDNNPVYRYNRYYIRHYSSERYRQQKLEFDIGKRFSKPDGRTKCGPFSESDLSLLKRSKLFCIRCKKFGAFRNYGESELSGEFLVMEHYDKNSKTKRNRCKIKYHELPFITSESSLYFTEFQRMMCLTVHTNVDKLSHHAQNRWFTENGRNFIQSRISKLAFID